MSRVHAIAISTIAAAVPIDVATTIDAAQLVEPCATQAHCVHMQSSDMPRAQAAKAAAVAAAPSSSGAPAEEAAVAAEKQKSKTKKKRVRKKHHAKCEVATSFGGDYLKAAPTRSSSSAPSKSSQDSLDWGGSEPSASTVSSSPARSASPATRRKKNRDPEPLVLRGHERRGSRSCGCSQLPRRGYCPPQPSGVASGLLPLSLLPPREPLHLSPSL